MTEEYSSVCVCLWVYYIYFICSSVDEHLDRFLYFLFLRWNSHDIEVPILKCTVKKNKVYNSVTFSICMQLYDYHL